MSGGRMGPNLRIARTVVRVAVVLVIVVGFAVGLGWGTVCVAGIDAVAALCPLGALEVFLASKIAAPRAVVAVLCALVIIALLGRAFCAWVCPVPPIRGFFGREKRMMRSGVDPDTADAGTGAKRARRDNGAPAAGGQTSLDGCGCERHCSGCSGLSPVGGKRNGVRLDTRHAVLVGALASSAVFGFPVFCLVCPLGLTFATLFAVWTALANHNPSWVLVVFPTILVVELVLFRTWCHRFCPVGALLSLVGAKAPIAKPQVDVGRCLRSQGIDCRGCTDICPERLDPHEGAMGECTRCGLCWENCPAGAITMGSRRKRKNVGVGLAGAAVSVDGAEPEQQSS